MHLGSLQCSESTLLEGIPKYQELMSYPRAGLNISIFPDISAVNEIDMVK